MVRTCTLKQQNTLTPITPVNSLIHYSKLFCIFVFTAFYPCLLLKSRNTLQLLVNSLCKLNLHAHFILKWFYIISQCIVYYKVDSGKHMIKDWSFTTIFTFKLYFLNVLIVSPKLLQSYGHGILPPPFCNSLHCVFSQSSIILLNVILWIK